MADPRPKMLAGMWDFTAPTGGGSAAADPAKLVRVTLLAETTDFAAMLAESYDFASGSASGPRLGAGSFAGSGTLFTGCLYVGSVHAYPGGGNNKLISVRPLLKTGSVGNPQSVAFEAYQGSVACDQLLFAAATGHRCDSCASEEPLPAALSLQQDSPGVTDAGGAAPHQLVALRHSGDHGFGCCWLSQPVDPCSDPADPALWMLRKTDATTWRLVLRRGEAEIVSYALNAAAGRAGSLPLRLTLEGDEEGSENWPQTVTVGPAS